MLKAIIFDCFGVLATDGWQVFKRQHLGHDNRKLQQASEQMRLLDAGLQSYDDFLATVAGLAKVTTDDLDKTMKSAQADPQLLDFIAHDLKPHYKLGLLSNVADSWLQSLFTAEQYALFDAKVLSYQTGHPKPHPMAYQAITQKLALEPADCLFVDDQARNVTGAHEAGMQAIEYQNLTQFQAYLKHNHLLAK